MIIIEPIIWYILLIKLKIRGYPYVEESSSTEYDQNFLENLLDLQEQIEECQTREELLIKKNQIVDIIKSDIYKVEHLFKLNECEQILEILKKVKFHSNIIDQINNKI